MDFKSIKIDRMNAEKKADDYIAKAKENLLKMEKILEKITSSNEELSLERDAEKNRLGDLNILNTHFISTVRDYFGDKVSDELKTLKLVFSTFNIVGESEIVENSFFSEEMPVDKFKKMLLEKIKVIKDKTNESGIEQWKKYSVEKFYYNLKKSLESIEKDFLDGVVEFSRIKKWLDLLSGRTVDISQSIKWRDDFDFYVRNSVQYIKSLLSPNSELKHYEPKIDFFQDKNELLLEKEMINEIERMITYLKLLPELTNKKFLIDNMRGIKTSIKKEWAIRANRERETLRKPRFDFFVVDQKIGADVRKTLVQRRDYTGSNQKLQENLVGEMGYKILEEISNKGATGTIYLVRREGDDNSDCAIAKVIKPSRNFDTESLVNFYLCEAYILREFEKKGIECVPKILAENKGVCIVMEKVNGIPLENLKNVSISIVDAVREIFLPIIKLTKEQCNLGVINLDAKFSANVFYDQEKKQIKVIDFGLLNKFDKENKEQENFIIDMFASFIFSTVGFFYGKNNLFIASDKGCCNKEYLEVYKESDDKEDESRNLFEKFLIELANNKIKSIDELLEKIEELLNDLKKIS